MLKQHNFHTEANIKVHESTIKLIHSPFVLTKNTKAKALLDDVGLPDDKSDSGILKSTQRTQLIEEIVKSAKITKRKASDALNAIINALEYTLTHEGEVSLTGFGTFSVYKRSARIGRNPRTGKLIKIKAKKVTKFIASQELMKKVNR